jgi:hypothetical protein
MQRLPNRQCIEIPPSRKISLPHRFSFALGFVGYALAGGDGEEGGI